MTDIASKEPELLVQYPSWPTGSPTNTNNTSPCSPSVCTLRQNFYMYWKGNASGTQAIFYSSASGSGGQQTWATGQVVVGMNASTVPLKTPAAPACCVFNSMVYLFYINSSSPPNIVCGVSPDGINFVEGYLYPSGQAQSPSAPACCVFNNTIYVFFQGNDNKLYFSTSTDGRDFSPAAPITNAATQAAPACCVFNDALYVFFAGNGTATNPQPIYYTALKQGGNFSNPVPINSTDKTQNGPACCVSPDSTTLCVFWRSATGSNLYWSPNKYSVSGSNFNLGQPITATTTQSPAAGTFGQYMYLFWPNSQITPSNPANAIDCTYLSGA